MADSIEHIQTLLTKEKRYVHIVEKYKEPKPKKNKKKDEKKEKEEVPKIPLVLAPGEQHSTFFFCFFDKAHSNCAFFDTHVPYPHSHTSHNYV